MLSLDIALSSLKSHFQVIHTVMPSCAQSIVIMVIIMAIKIKIPHGNDGQVQI